MTMRFWAVVACVCVIGVLTLILLDFASKSKGGFRDLFLVVAVSVGLIAACFWLAKALQ